MKKLGSYLKQHPKMTGLIATVAVAGAAYYGVPPEYSNQALAYLAALLGM